VKILNDSLPWATIMTAVLVAIAAIAGGVVVIVNPDSLNFEQYLNVLKQFAIAVGIIGVGRGIASNGKQTAKATLLQDDSLVPPAPASTAPTAADLADSVPAYGLMTYDSLSANDPYAGVVWPDAPPPPQPAVAADGTPLEV
jgi:hypothetical protein